MKTLIMLVGVPGSGKSTYAHKLADQYDFAIEGSDQYVEAEAVRRLKTYDQVWSDYYKTANELMWSKILLYHDTKISFIWDQTNLSVRQRKQKLNYFDNSWFKIAVAFPIADHERSILQTRLDGRPGKVIPTNVIENMLATFEMPTYNEGFEAIRVITLS